MTTGSRALIFLRFSGELEASTDCGTTGLPTHLTTLSLAGAQCVKAVHESGVVVGRIGNENWLIHHLVTAVVTAGIVTNSPAQCNYETTVLDYPVDCGLGAVITVGTGLNDDGAVVGYWKCPVWENYESFIWTAEEGFRTLARPLEVSSSAAADLSNSGLVIGTYTVSGTGFRGFTYEGGQYTELLPAPGGVYSWANGVNENGQVAGSRSIADGVLPISGFVWSSASGFIDFGIMGGPDSFALGINDHGEVVGWTGNQTGSVAEAFLWHGGELTLLGPIPGGFTSQAFAISDSSVVVGSGRIEMDGSPVGASRAFRWCNNSYTPLGTLPGRTRSRANDIHPLGWQVVGRSWDPSHAFIWQNGVITDLNDVVISPPAGLIVVSATAVNSSGIILCDTSHEGNESATALLTPIDRPIGDIDIDCRVGVIDFLLLLADWGESDSPADLDGDGEVGLGDFGILLDNWG